jgi:predicted transcriptional regulator
MIAKTSVQTYHSFKPRALQKKEQEVIKLFYQHDGLTVTRERLAQMMEWKESSICGRINSLVAKHCLQEVEGGKTMAGKSAMLVRLPVYEQVGLF